MMGDTAYPAANSLKRAKNLSDVADAATALSNLGGASSASVVEITDVADGEVYQRSGAAVAGVSLGALATGADAGDVPYTPTTGGDWTDPDPDDAAEALDDLASRLTTHEAATVDITDVSDGEVYTRSGAGVAGTTLGDLATGTINDLTAQGTPTGGTDYVVIWDAGLGAHRKVLLNDLPGGGGGGGGLNDVVDDTTPQLGGDLDVNGNSIVSVSNGDVDIAPNGTGRLTVQGDIYTAGDIVLEGATANDFETTITVTDPTADRTITAPDATGTIVTTGNADVGTTTADTADVDHILVNDGGTLKKITPGNLGVLTSDSYKVGSFYMDGTTDNAWEIASASVNAPNLVLTGDFTLEAEVMSHSVSGNRGIVGCWPENYWFLIDTSSNELELRVYDDTGGAVRYYTQMFDPYQEFEQRGWTHVAVAFDLSTATAYFYVDGHQVGSDTTAITDIRAGTNDFAIGAQPGSTSRWDGWMTNVRVWSTLRTAAEIRDNRRVKLPNTTLNLEGNWRFDDFDSPGADSSINGYTVTSAGTPTMTNRIPWEIYR